MLALLTAVILVSGAQPARAQPVSEEYKVKAAFLFHFAQLVDWPADSPGSADKSLDLCIYNDEPHREELQSILQGKIVGTRVLHVRSLSLPQDVKGCSILFLSRDEARRQTTTLRSVHGQPILTVGETDNFLSDGGMIQLHIEQDKVRFDINLGAADSSHLKISSRLLLLASSIKLDQGPARGRIGNAP